MRFALLAACFVLTAALRAADVEFVRVWPAWRDAASFETIGEYFGGAENPRGQVVVRSQSAARDGYYFLVRTRTAGVPAAGARFVLELIRPDAPEAKRFSFPAAFAGKETVFQLGLTGADWPGGKNAHPVAWRLTLRDGADRVLAGQKSFLWEKPAK